MAKFKKHKFNYYNNSAKNRRNHVQFDQYVDFLADFAQGKYGAQRIGQAFYNKFNATGLPFPELFQETDKDKAIALIESSYKLYYE
jgi:hypothetical protein